MGGGWNGWRFGFRLPLLVVWLFERGSGWACDFRLLLRGIAIVNAMTGYLIRGAMAKKPHISAVTRDIFGALRGKVL